MFQILAARGALALEDASGACGDCGPIDGPSGVDDGLHRFDGGGEPAFGGHDADVVEQVGPHVSVHAVEQGPHGIGEIVPDWAFAPYARLARDDREQARRIRLDFRRFPPHAFQRDDVPAIGIAKLDLETRTPACKRIERHLGRNDHYWEAYWESVSEAAHGLVRQASKQPDCFTPEAENPYPLCIGSGKSECDDCCLYVHMKGEGGYEC